VKDAVAAVLGIDDGDTERISWVYAEQDREKRYGARVEVQEV
jgi:hypothetical protein